MSVCLCACVSARVATLVVKCQCLELRTHSCYLIATPQTLNDSVLQTVVYTEMAFLSILNLNHTLQPEAVPAKQFDVMVNFKIVFCRYAFRNFTRLLSFLRILWYFHAVG